MKEEEKTETSSPNPSFLDGIDQIRDIILGEQISGWEKRFGKLEAELKALAQKTESSLKELSEKIDANLRTTTGGQGELKAELDNKQAELKALLENYKSQLEKHLGELAEQKVDKDSIGEVFIQWGQKVKAR